MNELESNEDVKNVKICNKCGKKIIQEDKEDLFWDAETIKIGLKFTNYGNRHDLEQWEFIVCMDCLDEFVKDFVVPVEVSDINCKGVLLDRQKLNELRFEIAKEDTEEKQKKIDEIMASKYPKCPQCGAEVYLMPSMDIGGGYVIDDAYVNCTKCNWSEEWLEDIEV